MPSVRSLAAATAILGAAAASAAPSPAPFPEAEVERLWARFRQAYGREYLDSAESALRLKAFKLNLARAHAMNLEQGIHCTDLLDDETCVFGVTKFSDLFPDEFAATRLGYRPPSGDMFANVSVLSTATLPAAPDSKDWRSEGAVTKVKDQGQCGSCWAFSTTEEVESQIFMATGKLPVLSTQQIISCDKVDQGCDGGNTETAYQYIKKAGGLDTAEDYPDKSHATGETGKCHWDKKEVAKVTGFTYATKPCKRGRCKHQDEEGLAQALAAKGPISICVNAGDAGWQSYTGGVYSRKCSAAIDDQDHCVQLVGYNKAASKPYWIVRNSWNTDWGIDGYMYLAMGNNLCGVADDATIAEVKAGEDDTIVV